MLERRDIHNSDIPVLCRSCEARHRGVCGALSAEQLVALSKASSRRKVEAGSELIANAEAVDHYSNILSGAVKLTKTLADGRQQIVGLQFAPDFLGRPFHDASAVNAEAATVTSLCSFPRSALARMMNESPDLQRRLFEQALRELDEAREWMLTLGRKNAGEKVASFLLLIARNIDPGDETGNGELAFDLPLTRADIADFLGLTIETVSRELTKLRSSGIISIEHNRHIVVGNMARLVARSGS
ncbi:Crp/Fnr family transcriptional regulator [Rhizobium sp. LCM 4573]|uniref:Crp/Fnr family transcriptional regulator n=1 Tax=Rhizobium sp. LCM 4573 TaxID=1848291 RepID=UPI0008DA2278|nr:Crp/Fnr family transcriptional regulator [Rhizobium sp. LCM 4573]OHV82320.1 transcriptional regulator [Rhizobium sp. LCM 4573]